MVTTWHWPQYAIIIIFVLLTLYAETMHGKSRPTNFNFVTFCTVNGVLLFILYIGGFWG